MEKNLNFSKQLGLNNGMDIQIKFPVKIQLGSSIPPADALKNIADALGVSSDALLNDETVSIKDIELLKKGYERRR